MLQNANLTWGTVTVEDLGPEMATVRGEPLRVHASRYIWTPDSDLKLPSDFKLVLKCWDTDGKSRRFFPDESLGTFLGKASEAGTAILERLGKLNRPERYSYHMARVLFQRARGLRDHLMRKFVCARDLYVTAAARVAGESDVLPPSLGLDNQQEGRQWSVSELLKRGREFASERGNEAPDEEDCIRLGLLAAAQLCPLDVSSVTKGQARGLVRMSLFGTGPSSELLNEETKSRVEKQLLSAIDRHLDDDQEKFNRWFFTNADNLIRQVAKQKRRGGPVPRETVRQVLLDLVFRSHSHIAWTIEVFLRDFAISPHVGLSGDELTVFEQMYYCRDELGGLSLLMLRDRFPLIREVVLELLGSPQNVELLGVLLQMLRFYAEMVETRRAADSEYKSRCLRKNASGRTATMVASSDNFSAERNSSQLEDLAINILEMRGMACRCDSLRELDVKVAGRDPSGKTTFNIGCCNCGDQKTIQASMDELQAAAKRLADKEKQEERDRERRKLPRSRTSE